MALPVRAEALLLSALSLASVTPAPDPSECDTDLLGTRGGERGGETDAADAADACELRPVVGPPVVGEARPVVGEARPAPEVVLAAGMRSRLCSCTKAEVSSAFMRHTW